MRQKQEDQYSEMICYSTFCPEEGNIRSTVQKRCTETLCNQRLDIFIGIYVLCPEKNGVSPRDNV